MSSFEKFIHFARLIRQVSRVAAGHGCNGDLYDDDQRRWRDPSELERSYFVDIFRELASYYVLEGETRKLIKSLVWNAVMNTKHSSDC